MKVLLRETKTRLFYAGTQQWITDAKQAWDFDRVEEAIRLSREEQLTDAEVVLRFDDPACDAVLPLRTPGQPGKRSPAKCLRPQSSLEDSHKAVPGAVG